MAEITKLEQFCQAVGDGLRLVQAQRSSSMLNTEHHVADYLGIGIETLRSWRYRSRNRASIEDKSLALFIWVVLNEGKASAQWLKRIMGATSLIIPEPLTATWLECYLQCPFKDKQPLDLHVLSQVIQTIIEVDQPIQVNQGSNQVMIVPNDGMLARFQLPQIKKRLNYPNNQQQLLGLFIILIIVGWMLLEGLP